MRNFSLPSKTKKKRRCVVYDLFSSTFSRTNCCNQSYASSNVLLPNLAKMMVSREEVIDHLKGTMSDGEGSYEASLLFLLFILKGSHEVCASFLSLITFFLVNVNFFTKVIITISSHVIKICLENISYKNSPSLLRCCQINSPLINLRYFMVID